MKRINWPVFWRVEIDGGFVSLLLKYMSCMLDLWSY